MDASNVQTEPKHAASAFLPSERHPACRGGSSAFALLVARVVQKRRNHWDKPKWRLCQIQPEDQ